MNNVLRFPQPRTMTAQNAYYRHRTEVPAVDPCQERLYLAPRYLRVVILLSQGATPQEVARELRLKPVTTWGYMEEIFLKNAELRRCLALYVLELLRGESEDDAS